MRKILAVILIFLSVPGYILAQEIDDMYFTSKDRNIKKVKKITPANVILSKYRSGSSEINIDNKISSVVINKYKTNNSSVKNNRDVKINNLGSLKFNRDELFRSSYFNKNFLDFNTLILFNRVQPNYYSFYDPYYSPFSNNLFSLYNYRWMPRSLHGIRNLAAYDPMMFFSNPYLSSYYPMMSPSLWNIHHPSFSTYGCNGLNANTHPAWIWTSNGTGGGLQTTISNYHHYTNGYSNNENSEPVVKGPRSGRGSAFNGENLGNILPADRYLGRRESGITNKNIQRGTNDPIDPMDQTQNAYFRGRSSNQNNYVTRSLRSNSAVQNSNRRSMNQDRNFNSRVNALNDTFNSLRSNRNNNVSVYDSNDSGRRASYSSPSNYGSNRSGVFSSYSSNKNTSSGIGSRSSNSSSNYSGNSSSSSGFSGGSSGGSSGTTVSGGSSGGSSRGNN